jgi:hypothetical protein
VELHGVINNRAYLTTTDKGWEDLDPVRKCREGIDRWQVQLVQSQGVASFVEAVNCPDWAAGFTTSGQPLPDAFNRTIRREANLRTFEAAACGALLLQEADNLEALLGRYLGRSSRLRPPPGLGKEPPGGLGPGRGRRPFSRRGAARAAWAIDCCMTAGKPCDGAVPTSPRPRRHPGPVRISPPVRLRMPSRARALWPEPQRSLHPTADMVFVQDADRPNTAAESALDAQEMPTRITLKQRSASSW